MSVLTKVVCFLLDTTIYSGRKKLRPSDIKKLTAGQIPPEDLASLGSKKVLSPDALAPFNRLKKEAERYLESKSLRFLKGFAVPEDKAEEVALELARIGEEFAQEKQSFLTNYDGEIQKWKTAHPGWESIIDGAIDPASHVSSRLYFGFHTFRVEYADTQNANSVLNAGLAMATSTLGDQLFEEIAQAANKAWEESFAGKDKVGQKALRPIRSILDKLNGLLFVDVRAAPVAERIEEILGSLPKTGWIEGDQFLALTGLLYLLSKPDRMKGYGQAAINGANGVAITDPDEQDGPIAAEPGQVENVDDVPVAQHPSVEPDVVVTEDQQPAMVDWF